MARIIPFNRKPPPQTTAPPVIQAGETYTLEDIATGIEIAMMVTHDTEAVAFLMKKFQQAVNQKSILVTLNIAETQQYLDYLDIVKSPRNSELRLQVAGYKY